MLLRRRCVNEAACGGATYQRPRTNVTLSIRGIATRRLGPHDLHRWSAVWAFGTSIDPSGTAPRLRLVTLARKPVRPLGSPIRPPCGTVGPRPLAELPPVARESWRYSVSNARGTNPAGTHFEGTRRSNVPSGVHTSKMTCPPASRGFLRRAQRHTQRQHTRALRRKASLLAPDDASHFPSP